MLFIWENDVDTTFYIVKIGKDEKFILRVPPIHKLSEFVQNNQWNSLDKETGFFQKRKNSKWEDIPKMSYEDVGKDNKGTSRIRKE
nr:hypothetical protein [Enterococcus faecalis]